MHSHPSKLILLAAAVALLLAPNVSRAQQPVVTATLTDPTTGLSVITVAPNGTVQLTLQITTE